MFWRVSSKRTPSPACQRRTISAGNFARRLPGNSTTLAGNIPARGTEQEQQTQRGQRGSVQPAYFERKYGARPLERFAPQLASLNDEGFLAEVTPERIARYRAEVDARSDTLNRLALAQKPDTICVSCPYCMTMLSDGVKNKELEDTVKNRDVLELAADEQDKVMPTRVSGIIPW